VPDFDDLILNTVGGIPGWAGGRMMFHRQTFSPFPMAMTLTDASGSDSA
jgi:glycopeptide antibiotics resistance protein